MCAGVSFPWACLLDYFGRHCSLSPPTYQYLHTFLRILKALLSLTKTHKHARIFVTGSFVHVCRWKTWFVVDFVFK